MLEYAFMQRALAAALVVGLACGALGFFVVLRRMAFVGVGISHSAIGGVAIGILAGWNPLSTAALFALLVALGIAWSSRRARVSEDAAIGVFFSGSMALGVVLMSWRRGYQQDLFGYLFGNVLAISTGELLGLGALAVVVIGVLALVFQPLLLIAFDEELARAYGYRVDALNALLLAMLAATVVIGVRLVGVLLVEALLVVPAAVATAWAANYRGQLALSIAIGAGCGTLGLAAAWVLDLAAGGTIALVAVALFLVSAVVRGASR